MLGQIEYTTKGSAGAIQSLRHWARVFHPASSELKLLAMFTAYFDESGIHGDARICVMAAYLAPEKEWERFIPKWQKVLSDNGISVFHANECNSNKKEFRKYKEKREERNLFVADLLGIISERPRIVPFLTGVVIEDYDKDLRSGAQPDAKHPYFLGFMALITQIGIWMNLNHYPPQEKVACIFDRQAEFSQRAVTMFNKALEQADHWEGRERFSAIGFESKKIAIPLQAADALAYDAYREMCRRKYHPERAPRPSFRLLSKGVSGFMWDSVGIQGFLKSLDAKPTDLFE